MTNVLDRVRKLLALAKSGTPEEAALATARAQELMFKYSIGEADLEVEQVQREIEAVVDEIVHEEAKTKRDLWKGVLLNTLALAFGCKSYSLRDWVNGGTKFKVLGVNSAVQTVNYLFGYLQLELDRLADAAFADHLREVDQDVSGRLRQNGRSFRNSFRMGAVNTIFRRLQVQIEDQKRIIQAKKAAAPKSMALALYQGDVERTEEAYRAKKKELNLRHSKSRSSVRSISAYQRGSEAGANVSLGGGKAIAGSKPRIES
jgi:hypothetical protein